MRRGLLCSLVLVLAMPIAACGGEDDTAEAASAVATSAAAAPSTEATLTVPPSAPAPRVTDAVTTTRATAAPTTQAPTTTARPSTTVGFTTVETLAPSTTLPTPVAPPPPRAEEPYVELGTIEIPALGLEELLLEGITLNTLDLAPGHWPGTAMPGHPGNVVIAGHRTSHAQPFRHVDRLAIGDEVIFTTAEGRFTYEVTGTTIVMPDAMYIIDQTPEATATLFACHPPGSARQRIVVSLALVS